MSDDRWATARLDEIERSGARSEWIPIRRHFGIASFGVNAWSGDEGKELVGEHDEVPTGHEELYVVVEGARRSRWTVRSSMRRPARSCSSATR